MTKNTPSNPTQYLGKNSNLTYCVIRSRRPLGTDVRQPETGKLYPVSTFWQVDKDPTSGTEGELWVLSKIVSKVAYWIQVNSGGGGGGNVSNLTGSNDNAMAIYDGVTGTIIKSASALQDGELYVGSTGNTPIATTLTPPASGFTITNTSGSIKFDLANDLLAIESLNTNGIAVKSGADTWVTRTLVAGSGINITNADGVGGDITISATGGGGGGNVSNVTGSSDNAMAIYDGTGGTLIKSAVALQDGQLYIGSTGSEPVASALTAPVSGIGITSGSGTVTFSLKDDLDAVESLSTNGLVVRTAPDTWSTRTLTAGTGISITNADGISGNPVINSTSSGSMVMLTGNVIDFKSVGLQPLLTISGGNFCFVGINFKMIENTSAIDSAYYTIGWTAPLYGDFAGEKSISRRNKAVPYSFYLSKSVYNPTTGFILNGTSLYVNVRTAMSLAPPCKIQIDLIGYYQ